MKTSASKHTKDHGVRIRWRGMECINIRMGLFIGVNGRIISRMGKGSMSSETEHTITENGETT